VYLFLVSHDVLCWMDQTLLELDRSDMKLGATTFLECFPQHNFISTSSTMEQLPLIMMPLFQAGAFKKIND
jgi:hypothetical protein